MKKTGKRLASVLIATALTISSITMAMASEDVATVGESKSFAGNSQNTDFYLKAGDKAIENISATMPIKVVLAVAADNSLIAPSSDAYGIKNTGAIAFHLSKYQATQVSPYHFESSLTDENKKDGMVVSFTDDQNNGGFLVNNFEKLPEANTWNINSGERKGIIMKGSLGFLSHDITTEDKAFQIVFTIKAGLH